MEESKKAKIEPFHKEESAALKRIYKERSKISQEKFGDEFEIGSQGMVWQYLNARSPLNLQAAVKFAIGLGCDIKDFSRRLADEQEKVAESRTVALSSRARRAAELFDVLSDEKQVEVLHYLSVETRIRSKQDEAEPDSIAEIGDVRRA